MTATKITELKENLSTICKLVFDHGYTPGKSGNISTRSNETDLLITPSGWSFMDIKPNDIVHVSSDGSVQTLKPSSELPVHKIIYDTRTDINAVIHAHPTKATALAVAGIDLNTHIIPELSVSLGPVPLIAYRLPGSPELANDVKKAFENNHQAILMANHGVITTGRDLKEAFFNLQLLESFAEIVITCKQLGTINTLTGAQVEEIYQLKASMAH